MITQEKLSGRPQSEQEKRSSTGISLKYKSLFVTVSPFLTASAHHPVEHRRRRLKVVVAVALHEPCASCQTK